MDGCDVMKYESKLTLFETQVAIKTLKDFFERQLAKELSLTRVSAPLFVIPETGLNDNLNGIEKPVTFTVEAHQKVEVVQSLAKWKRMAIYNYKINEKNGIYTDMNAIRKDEQVSPIHSYYVDQWDWERVMPFNRRNSRYLKHIVHKIYNVLKTTDEYIVKMFPTLKRKLPEDIYFITAQSLEDLYPNLSSKDRENAITKKHQAVFISNIGHTLKSGHVHDDRAPDYDDWTLNGDILFYNKVLDQAFEISSMGIRVNAKTLHAQLVFKNTLDRLTCDYHQAVMNDILPQTIGGGIGQSRLCMFFLEKAHIGEVQSSVWPQSMIETCKALNIHLL